MLETDYQNLYHLTEEEQKILPTIEAILQYAFAKEGHENHTYEVGISFLTNEEIRETNKLYRKKDAVTDVITFAFNDYDDGIVYDETMDIPISLGEILVSVERAREQAIEYQHSFERELCFLVLHGYLHLEGYDHMVEKDEKVMFALQDEILEQYNIHK